MSQQQTTDRPLSGMRVIDLTHVLAGPYCTYQLGLLGAEVIKVEAPGGDMVRGWGGNAAQLAHKVGTGFAAQNAGKRSVAIDITRTEGAALVRRLAAGADIFVENFRPGSLEKYGLGYEDLRMQRADLIYASISAFGQNGPEGDRPGFDDVVQATSGFMSINVRGDGPIRTGGPVLDYATGMHAASAILAAVLLRERTGESQRVDLAMQDVTLLLMNRNTSIVASTGEQMPPAGNREGPMLGRFATRDGYVMLAGYLPRHCRSICAALGLDRYAAMTGRELTEQAVQLESDVAARLLQKSSAEWDAIFAEHGVVAGGVRDLVDVLDQGQPAARKLLVEAASPAGPVNVTTAGYLMNEACFAPQGGVPGLGEHTLGVLGELGMDADTLEALRADRVIATLPPVERSDDSGG